MRVLNLEGNAFHTKAIAELKKHVYVDDCDRDYCLANIQIDSQYEGLLTKLKYLIDKKLMDQFPYLKWIGTPTTGLNHIDLDYCKHMGIRVLSLKGEVGFLKDIWSTAEHTIGLIFAITRKIVASHHDEHLDRYDFCGRTLRGKTLGIVGYGRVGQQVEQLAKGIGLNVLYCDITDLGYPRTLETVLTHSDIISLHADYRQENKRMVNKYWFKKMKKSAYFINTSRGEMVNENDLIEALNDRKIAGAAIDVVTGNCRNYQNETLKLFSLANPDRLIITPHIAGCTFESMEMTDKFLINKIIKGVYGGK